MEVQNQTFGRVTAAKLNNIDIGTCIKRDIDFFKGNCKLVGLIGRNFHPSENKIIL
jgi:hypothetical protein